MDSPGSVTVRVLRDSHRVRDQPLPLDRELLDGIRQDRNAAQKHVWRAEIVLLSADGVGTNEIMRRTGTSKTCVWRWQERFMHEGVSGYGTTGSCRLGQSTLEGTRPQLLRVSLYSQPSQNGPGDLKNPTIERFPHSQAQASEIVR